jgi:hypothetical protein
VKTIFAFLARCSAPHRIVRRSTVIGVDARTRFAGAAWGVRRKPLHLPPALSVASDSCCLDWLSSSSARRSINSLYSPSPEREPCGLALV